MKLRIMGKPPMPDQDYISVSQLNNYISQMFSLDEVLSSVAVEGEISNFKSHSSGHLYFSVKDAYAKINCVMFRSAAQRMKFVPRDGMKVVIYGYVGVYEKTGSYQLYVSAMKEQGFGSLYEKYRQLLDELDKKGYFSADIKKNIPFLPNRVALVTSPTGAAVRDMISVIRRRCPMCEIIICPVLVQGGGAAGDIASMIDYINEYAIADVIITGRGGGSIEELWAFNETVVADSVFCSAIPVISAVGHETDVTICDFVADIRAATPSAAAEIAVPDIRDLRFTLDKYDLSLREALSSKGKSLKQKLDFLCRNTRFSEPELITENRLMYLNSLQDSLRRAAEEKTASLQTLLKHKEEMLKSLNYERVLARGFCLMQKDGKIISGDEIFEGDKAEILTSSHVLGVTVDKITER